MLLISIECTPKDIAALVLELQERHSEKTESTIDENELAEKIFTQIQAQQARAQQAFAL